EAVTEASRSSLLVWDGDELKETSFTRLIPEYLKSGESRRVVAFRINDSIDSFKASWRDSIQAGHFVHLSGELLTDTLSDVERFVSHQHNHQEVMPKLQARTKELASNRRRSLTDAQDLVLQFGLSRDLATEVRHSRGGLPCPANARGT
ncbi:MGAT4C, partial [Symbiodinium sp. CCMP2592]